MFIARSHPRPPASFGGADTPSYRYAKVCPLLRTKQAWGDFGAINMSLLQSENRLRSRLDLQDSEPATSSFILLSACFIQAGILCG